MECVSGDTRHILVFSNQRCGTSNVAYTREQCVKAASSAVMEEAGAVEEALACFFERKKRARRMYLTST